jgi:hypothetical protein
MGSIRDPPIEPGQSASVCRPPANDNRRSIGRLADALIDMAPGLPADAATMIGQLAIALERFCADRHNPDQLTDNGIVDGGSGSSTETEEPMYRWVAVKPEPHRSKFRVAVRKLDGKQVRHSFDSEGAARAFIEKASARKLSGGGTKIEKAIAEYLGGRTDLKPSSVATLRFRLATITKGRTQYPIEAFPWERAWRERVVAQSRDSQLGIRSALAGLLEWAAKQRILRKAGAAGDRRAAKQGQGAAPDRRSQTNGGAGNQAARSPRARGGHDALHGYPSR